MSPSSRVTLLHRYERLFFRVVDSQNEPQGTFGKNVVYLSPKHLWLVFICIRPNLTLHCDVTSSATPSSTANRPRNKVEETSYLAQCYSLHVSVVSVTLNSDEDTSTYVISVLYTSRCHSIISDLEVQICCTVPHGMRSHFKVKSTSKSRGITNLGRYFNIFSLHLRSMCCCNRDNINFWTVSMKFAMPTYGQRREGRVSGRPPDAVFGLRNDPQAL